jgi:hypothetical protein
MEHAFILGVTVVTSVGAYVVAVRWLGWSPAALPTAVSRMLELVGTALIFFVVNAAIGLAVILAVRSTTALFLSSYLLNDVSLLVMSVLQGLVFDCWRARSVR